MTDAAGGIPGLDATLGGGPRTRHSLTVPDGVAADRVEGLLRQHFPDLPALPREPSTIPIRDGAELHGPTRLGDGRVRWSMDVVRMRLEDDAAVQAEFADVFDDDEWLSEHNEDDDPDGLLEAFAGGEPTGVEEAVVRALVGVARRTGGVVVVDEAAAGHEITPHPDVVVDVTVWWVGKPFADGELLSIVAVEAPDAYVPDPEDTFVGGELEALVGVNLSQEERDEITRAVVSADAHALGEAEAEEGWVAVTVPVDDVREVILEAHPTEADEEVPAVVEARLGRDSLMSCDVAWIPAWDGASRKSWLAECVLGRSRLGPVAFAVVEAVDGIVVDGDGLLVDRYSLLGTTAD